jgi:hypothetical protein
VSARSTFWIGVVAAAFVVAQPASAALPLPSWDGPDARRMLEAAGAPSCVCEEEQVELARYRDLVAAAASVEEARERAAKPSRLARRAIALARWISPAPSKLDETRARLAAYEARVATAPDAAAVAAEFEGLVRVAGGVDVKVGKGGGCRYDTTEVIAIILGFLFFIIPGIILLIVFC